MAVVGCIGCSMQSKAFLLLLFVSVGVTLAAKKPAKVGPWTEIEHNFCRGEFFYTIIGIDLGAAHSRVGVRRDGTVEVISIDSELLIGDGAHNQSILHSKSIISFAKRCLGRKFDDPEVQKDIKILPFKVVNQDGKPHLNVEMNSGKMKLTSPEEIIGMMLKRIKQTAESHLGEEIEKAVLTVPAFSYSRVQWPAFYDAAAIAGLSISHVVRDSIAAAYVHYGRMEKGVKANVLVFDLGGGTFDVTVMTIEGSVDNAGLAYLLSTNGNAHLGGEDFDNRVMGYFLSKIKNKYNRDVSDDKQILTMLKKECEKAKEVLSDQPHVHIEIKSLFDGVDFSEQLSREIFEELNRDLFEETIKLVKQALKDSQMEKKDIDDIVLLGGSTKIPKVRELLQDFFDGKEPNNAINPGEAVASGAGVQGAIISDRDSRPLLLNIPIVGVNFGIETAGGVMVRLIKHCSVLPLFSPKLGKRSQLVTTHQDDQTTVSIRVYKGDSKLKNIGNLNLSGIPPAPRGVPQIEVTMNMEEYGILEVTATEKASNKTNTITIRDVLKPSADDPWVLEGERMAKCDAVYRDCRISGGVEFDPNTNNTCQELREDMAEKLAILDAKALQDRENATKVDEVIAFLPALPERLEKRGTIKNVRESLRLYRRLGSLI